MSMYDPKDHPDTPNTPDALARALDALGERERAGLSDEAMETILAAVLRATDVPAVGGVRMDRALDELGRTERAGAPMSFEDRLSMATRGALPRQAAVRGAVASRPAPVRAWANAAWSAAAALLAIASVIAIFAVMGPGGAEQTPVVARPPAPDSAVLVAQLDDDFDDLFAVIELAALPDPSIRQLAQEVDSLAVRVNTAGDSGVGEIVPHEDEGAM